MGEVLMVEEAHGHLDAEDLGDRTVNREIRLEQMVRGIPSASLKHRSNPKPRVQD